MRNVGGLEHWFVSGTLGGGELSGTDVGVARMCVGGHMLEFSRLWPSQQKA